MSYTLGIDVGTTFSAAAICRDGRTETASLGDRTDQIPTVVFLTEDGEFLVGHPAIRRAVTDPTRVARAFKARVGDAVPLVLGGRAQTAAALTSVVLRTIHEQVTAREGGPPERTVLTYPASWGEHRRATLSAAAQDAGIADAVLLPEPVAAALHYTSRLGPDSLVGVYDLGGGTFDATILRRSGASFQVVGTPQGDEHLGGLDFDALVWDHVVGVLGPEPFDLGDEPAPRMLRAVSQAREAAVDAKEALAYDNRAVVAVTLPGLMTEVRLTRSEFEEMALPYLLRTVEVFRRACDAADVQPRALDALLLVGGSSRILLVGQLVANHLGVLPTVDAHPKLATCLGAALAGSRGVRWSPEAIVAPRPEPVAAPPPEEEEPSPPELVAASPPRAGDEGDDGPILPRSRRPPVVTAAALPFVVQVGGDGPARRRAPQVVAVVALLLVAAALVAGMVQLGR